MGGRTVGIVGGITTKDLDVILRLVLDEDVICMTARLGREGRTSFSF